MGRKISGNPLKSAHSVDQLDGLTLSQERAVQALLESRSIAAAARKADVGESDLRRRIERMEAFFFPKPKAVVYLDVLDENDEPWMIVGPDFEWTRDEDAPRGVPPELIGTEHAAAWTHHAPADSPIERAPP